MRVLVPLALLVVSALGCSKTAAVPPVSKAPEPTSPSRAEPAALHSQLVVEEASAPARAEGSFSVHRFSGSFAKVPLTLTEHVVRRDGDRMIVEYTLVEGERKVTMLRTWRHVLSDDLLKVRRVVDGEEQPAKSADLEALLEKTMLVPDSNDGKLGLESGFCMVGDVGVACDTTHYRATLGDKALTLSVTTSPELPGRDLRGEIRDAEGNVLYRADLVELKEHHTSQPGLARK